MTEIKIFSTNALRGVLGDLQPGLERACGHKIEIVWLTTNQTMARLRKGERGDVVIGTVEGLEQLQRQGDVVAGTRVVIGSTAVAIAVRRGAPKPDVSTADALKRALLEAKSVAWTTMGASGVHFERVIERLGIAAQVKTKSKGVVIPGGLIGELLARDEAALGIQMVSEILAVPGAELVAPLPPPHHNKTVFAVAVLTGATDVKAMRALIAQLTAPAAVQAMKEQGFNAP